MKALTVLKWLALGLGSMVLALALFLGFFNWNSAKGYLAGKVSETLGRTLTLEGDLDIDLGWSPCLRAGQIRLANAPWGQAPNLLELEALTACLDLSALLGGRLVLTELILGKPRVMLEVSPAGQGNWEFNTAATPQSGTAASNDPMTIPLIKHLWVEDGRLRYHDPNRTTDINATFATTRGPEGTEGIEAKAEGPLQGQNFQLSLVGGAALDLAKSGQAYPLALRLQAEGADHQPGARLELKAQLVQQDNDWQLRELRAQSGNSDLSGEISLATGGERPWIKADLASQTLDVDQLAGLFAGVDEAPSDKPVDMGLLSVLDADIAVRINTLLAAGLIFNNASANAFLKEGRLTVTPLSVALGGGGIAAELRLDASAKPPQGAIQVVVRQVDPGRLKPGDDAGLGVLDGDLKLALADSPAGQDKTMTLTTLLERLRVEEPSELSYRDPDAGTEITARITTTPATHESAPRLALDAKGQLQGQSVQLSLTGDPLARLAHLEEAYGLAGKLAVNDTQGQFEGQLSHRAERWQLQNFTAALGDSRINGEIGLDLKGERPLLIADLRADRLIPGKLAGLTGGKSDANDAPQADRTQTEGQSTADSGDLAFLRALNADLSLQAQQVAVPPYLDLRAVRTRLRLLDGQLVIEPLQADTEAGAVRATATVDARAPPVKASATARLEQLDLKKLLAPYGIDDARLGMLSGEVKLTAAGDQPVKLDAEGRYRDEAFKLRASGAPLKTLLGSNQLYSVDITLDIAKNQVQVQGKLPRPLDFQKLNLSVTAKGSDPALLSPLVGFPLPSIPPYDMKGQLLLQGNTLKLANFAGRMGDSDLAGSAQVALGGERPKVNADLTSRKVDFDDLAGLIGGTPSAKPGETASEEQRKEAAAKEKSPFLLPRKPLHLQRLATAVDGTIKFQGKRVEALKLPLNNIVANISIDNGQVSFKPLEIGLGDGSVRSQLTLNTRAATPRGELESEIRRVNLQKVLEPFEIADDSFGIISGRMKFWVTGDSIAEFFASADGGLFLLMTEGSLDALLTELAGLDAGESLAVLFTDPKASVPIDCLYADLHSKNGIMKLDTVVVDTRDTLFLADGFIDFNQELVSVVIDPKPKDFSILSARSPLHIEGRIKEPAARPSTSTLARGVAAVLAGLVNPLAALLPLMEQPETQQDSVYCQGLVDTLEKARRETAINTYKSGKSP